MCQSVLVSCGGHCVVDLGGGKDSYLGLPVSHREEEGNGGSVPWSWCRTRNQKWTRAKIAQDREQKRVMGKKRAAIKKRKKPPVLLCCSNLHVLYVQRGTVTMS